MYSKYVPDAQTEIFVNTRLWFKSQFSKRVNSGDGYKWPVDVKLKKGFEEFWTGYKLHYETDGFSLDSVRIEIKDNPNAMHGELITVKVKIHEPETDYTDLPFYDEIFGNGSKKNDLWDFTYASRRTQHDTIGR